MAQYSSLLPETSIRITPKLPLPPVRLCAPGAYAATVSISLKDGTFIGIPWGDGWILIEHPRPGVGQVGLPLDGRPLSWHSAWDEELVDLEVLQDEEWIPIEAWEDLFRTSRT